MAEVYCINLGFIVCDIDAVLIDHWETVTRKEVTDGFRGL